jgi:hypothetical protein
MFHAVAAADAGKNDFLQAIAEFDLMVQPGTKQPHPASRRIGLETKRLIGWAVKINVVTGQLTITAAKTAMKYF